MWYVGLDGLLNIHTMDILTTGRVKTHFITLALKTLKRPQILPHGLVISVLVSMFLGHINYGSCGSFCAFPIRTEITSISVLTETNTESAT